MSITADADDDAIEFIEDPGDNPEIAIQKSDRSAILLDCLKQSSPAHREIIDLVYYHGKSNLAAINRIVSSKYWRGARSIGSTLSWMFCCPISQKVARCSI